MSEQKSLFHIIMEYGGGGYMDLFSCNMANEKIEEIAREYCEKAKELLRELCGGSGCHPDPATTVAIKLFNMFCG